MGPQEERSASPPLPPPPPELQRSAEDLMGAGGFPAPPAAPIPAAMGIVHNY